MQSFGCTVCHEGQGSATSFAWAAHTPNDPESRRQWAAKHDWSANPHWDFPMLPRRFAESLCLKCHHQVLDLEPSERFADPPAPQLLAGYHLVRRLGCFACHEINGYDDAARQVAPDLRLEPDRYAQHGTAGAQGTNAQPPGTMRKVGPSLRHVAAKLDSAFLVDWIGDPARFRPDTTMPRPFGLWNHLPDRGLRDDAEARRESLAIDSVAMYLRERSLPFTYLDPPRDIASVTTHEEQQAQIARGRIAFEESGCLVCHNHADFPDFALFRDADAVHLGPDLTRTAAKFAALRNPHGPRWLYDWIQDPARYDPRTTMPSMQLAPVEQRDADERVVAVTDPVADIVAYLLTYRAEDWPPTGDEAVDAGGNLSPAQLSTLAELTVTYLRDVTSPATAEQFASQGIPAALTEQWQGPEQELVVATADGQRLTEDEWIRRRMFYVARRTLLANGCYGCHDIPGTEDAKPIGPTLTGWGRKSTAELAFGQVLQYVQPGTATPSSAAAPAELPPPYYRDELRAQSRIGFIYQKLSEPRSFDFLETDHKKYTARLRMPQFTLTPQQREAIATFVLGLVSDPPSSRFAYRPDARTAALTAGQDLLHTFQCRGCHVMEPDSWELAFAPDTFGRQRQTPPHPFVPAGVDDKALAASRDVDHRGWRRAVLRGLPKLADDGRAEILDALGDELAQLEDETFALEQLTHSFQLWRPAALDGWPYQVDEAALAIETRHIQRRRSAEGGALARYLLPHIVERDRAINPNVRGSQAWTWLPPPLLGEGTKVQPDWLHSYLLDPQPIRPAVAMRMPNYRLSPAETRTLVDYFAAKDRAPYPYPDMPERSERYLQLAAAAYADRLSKTDGASAASGNGQAPRGHLADAMRVVASSDYCIKCHQVGRYEPAGWNRAKAPDLAGVYSRLRADYLRTWLAHPAAVLPYTPMPVNIPYDPNKPRLGSTMSQDLYRGDTLEQLQALVDLLLNFDRYAIEQKRVVP
jgi:cbb3-type cytochrome oxidase cytochrome c subunit